MARDNKDIVLRQWYDELWNNWNISETWLTVDNLDLLQQLGAAPAANREG